MVITNSFVCRRLGRDEHNSYCQDPQDPHLFLAVNFFVQFNMRPWFHEVPKQNWLGWDNLLKSGVQFLHHAFHQVVKPGLVLLGDQAITEDPAALMVPQSQQVVFVLVGNPSKHPHERSKEVLRISQPARLVSTKHQPHSCFKAAGVEKELGGGSCTPSSQKGPLSKQLLGREVITAAVNTFSICPHAKVSWRDLKFRVICPYPPLSMTRFKLFSQILVFSAKILLFRCGTELGPQVPSVMSQYLQSCTYRARFLGTCPEVQNPLLA